MGGVSRVIGERQGASDGSRRFGRVKQGTEDCAVWVRSSQSGENRFRVRSGPAPSEYTDSRRGENRGRVAIPESLERATTTEETVHCFLVVISEFHTDSPRVRCATDRAPRFRCAFRHSFVLAMPQLRTRSVSAGRYDEISGRPWHIGLFGLRIAILHLQIHSPSQTPNPSCAVVASLVFLGLVRVPIGRSVPCECELLPGHDERAVPDVLWPSSSL